MRYLFYIILLTIVFACSKKDIETWKGEHYVYFTESEDLFYGNESVTSDSLNVSFFFYIEDVIQYPLEVALIGQLLSEDTPFKVVADKEKTTLPENLYEMPEHFTFGKGQLKDTIYVTLKNDPILKTNKFDLKLDIVKEGSMLTHKGKNATRLLKVSDMVEKPDWWLENPIEWYYLGTFTAKKYEKFMEATGVSSLDLNDLAEVRLLTLEFQNWLDRQDPKILDEDGNEMKTEIIG